MCFLPCRSAECARAALFEIAPAPLQHLDLVAVGVGDEEEAGDDAARRCSEIHQLARAEARRREPRMLGVDIIDRHGKMAVAVAEIVGLGPALVDRQFELERRIPDCDM